MIDALAQGLIATVGAWKTDLDRRDYCDDLPNQAVEKDSSGVPAKPRRASFDFSRCLLSTRVAAGLQRNDRNDDDVKTSPDPNAGDVTGNIQPTTPVRAEQVTKPPSKRIRHVQRRSRKVVHQRANRARVANSFDAQPGRRTAKPDTKFNAVY